MELHAENGQTIEDFAAELLKVSEVADVVGVFNDTRIQAQIWDVEPEDIVKRYYRMREEGRDGTEEE